MLTVPPTGLLTVLTVRVWPLSLAVPLLRLVAQPKAVCAPESSLTVWSAPLVKLGTSLTGLTVIVTIAALAEAADDEMWNGPSGVPDLMLGEGVLTLWFDAYVHSDDIRAAIGRASERGDGLHASVVYLAAELTKRGWGPATLLLDGEPRHDIGAGGPEMTGEALQFVLVATGRADPATMDLDPTVNIYAD